MTVMPTKYGQFALVTGASSGIGAEFAAQLAAAGFDLVLVARRHDRLAALADQLSAAGRRVITVPLDLALPGAVDELMARTEALDVGVVVAAAGVMVAGRFVDNDYAAESQSVALNTLALMQLAHRYGAAMASRGRGGLILLASTAGHAAMPFSANYAATKAYVSSLGRALHYELKPVGVDVLTLAPGPTDTEGLREAEGIDFAALPLPIMDSSAVVRIALKKLGRRSLVIPGAMNRVADFMGRHLPRSVMTALFGRLLAGATTPAPGVASQRQVRAS